jgi:hypothetical protein
MRVNKLRLKFLFAAGLGVMTSAPLAAKEDGLPDEAPTIFKVVIECRAIANPTERLACFDANVAKLDEAQQKNELFVADKAQVRETRKGLFGLSLPKIRIFGKGDDADEINSVDLSIVSIRQGLRGWVFELEDGSIWAQTDGQYSGRSPKQGQTLHVKRAAFNSYMAKVDGGSAFRAERLNKTGK